MAARETGFGAVEAYMHQGKLLALDLVVRLLENPLQVGAMCLTLQAQSQSWRYLMRTHSCEGRQGAMTLGLPTVKALLHCASWLTPTMSTMSAHGSAVWLSAQA